MIAHPNIAPADQFVFNDFDDFLKYVESNNYPFTTASEKKFEELTNSTGRMSSMLHYKAICQHLK